MSEYTGITEMKESIRQARIIACDSGAADLMDVTDHLADAIEHLSSVAVKPLA